MSEFRFFAISDFEYHTNFSQNLFSLPISQFQPTKRTTTDEISHELNVPYTVFEILVAIFAIVGNLMVIIVFQRERKLRRRTNYYIVSLAMADLLVGSLGVPFAIMASIGLPTNLYACLFTVSLLVVLCTISIFCLVAVSVDRYWAILYPMAYSRNVRTKTAIIIISMCWFAGTVVGFLPIFGWHAEVGPNQACLFVEVMDYNYLVFLYFATIITPALLMLAFYAHIYRVIIKQVRQIVTMNPVGDCSRRSSTAQINVSGPLRPCHGGTMLRVLGAARKRDVKATQNLSIIVLFFMICWIPLYTINCVKAFCPECDVHPKLTLFCIILSHLNSAVNPVLYAYHLKDFRAALKNLVLKIMGVDVEQPMETVHRLSMASQHRLHSVDTSMRNTLQQRIYIDSPIWLRQQQQQASKELQKCGIVTPCLNNINQTVAAVASATTDIEREMWNIAEASSGAEIGEISYEFPDDRTDSTPTPPPRRNRKLKQCPSTQNDGCDSPYSYENRNYSSTPEEPDFDEVFLPIRKQPHIGIDHRELSQSLIACAMLEKLKSDNSEYQIHRYSSEHPITDTNYNNEHEISPQIQNSNQNSLLCTPNGRLPKEESSLLTLKDNVTIIEYQHSFNVQPNGIYVIDKDTNPLSPGHKPKFKKAPHRSKFSLANSNKSFNHSYSYKSENSSPIKEQSPDVIPSTLASFEHSNSNSGEALSDSNTRSTDTAVPSTNNNISHANNNVNINAFLHSSPQRDFQRCSSPEEMHHNLMHHLEDKFHPLRTVNDFIISPLVKHSSIFHMFDSSESCSATASDSTMHRKTEHDQRNAIEESTITLTSEVIIDSTPSLVTTTKG